MGDTWAFGLNHALTVVGFALTLGIAIAGFRSFDKWKREKIEERRIDISLEALALAYEAGYIFDSIRNPMSYQSEWAEMEGDEAPDIRRAAGPFFAILKRVEFHKEYFDRIWKMQPRFMAVFGKEAAEIFMNVHKARRTIEVAARMLLDAAARGSDLETDFRKRLQHDVWKDEKNDKVGPLIGEFVTGVEKLCQPVITNRYSRK